MPTGNVRWFDEAKGYGFIIAEDWGSDVFVHQSAIQILGFRSLKDGEKVSYEVTKGPKGPQATKVRKF